MTDIGAETELTSTPRPAATSAIDWQAIIAGALVAVAISFVATAFGASIGLSAASHYGGPRPAVFYIALGLWMIFIAVSSFAAGGYLAGRLRRRTGTATQNEVDIRDGVNGLTVWAVAVVLGALLTASTLDSIARSAPGAASKSGTAISDRYVDRLLRGDGDAARPGADVISETTRSVVSRLVIENPVGNYSPEDRPGLSRQHHRLAH